MQVFANSVDARNFVLRLGFPDCSLLNTRTAYRIAQWIGRVLLTVEPYEEGSFGPWRLVWSEDWDDDYPEFNLLVHFPSKWELPTTHSGFVICDDKPVRLAVSAGAIAAAFNGDALLPYPDDLPPIGKLGISGISDALMARYWWAAIGGKKGEMVHAMLYGRMDYTIREQSFAFGWDNYPPEDNPDGEFVLEGL